MGFGKKIGIGVLAVVLVGGAFAYKPIKGFYEAASFYDTEKITENFRSSGSKFPHYVVKAGEPWKFNVALTEDIPAIYQYGGKVRFLKDMLETTGTTGLLIAKDDTILYEAYFQGEKEDDRHIQFSVTKSFVSALVGIAIEDGLIDSIDDPITKYVPELKESGYDGTKIRDILTMSSGIRFTEDYGDLTSDVNRMSMAIATGGSLDEFAASLVQEREPGTYNNYVSVDTHVLGMMLVKVTGQTLSQMLEERIWKPIGMEYDAMWSIDGEGMEVAMGGLQVALRDMAKMGRLYLNRGNWNGKQIVPAQWVIDSTTPSAPHLMPGNNPASHSPYGYAFQWWTPANPHGDFMASGIYHQFIYIDPTSGIVIAKTSAYKDFNNKAERIEKDEVAVAFQTISAALGDVNWDKQDRSLENIQTIQNALESSENSR